MLHETCLCAICINLILSKSHTHTHTHTHIYMLHTSLGWFRHVYIIQEIIKKVRKEFAKVKNEELVNITVIDFTDLDFVVVIFQIALDLFMTLCNTHIT